MKKLILVSILLASVQGVTAEKTYFVGDKEVSKVDALRALINNPKTVVTQCQQVELTDKATLRSK